MKTTHAIDPDNGPVYEIESDRHGSFTIRLDGRVIKRVTSVSNYVGRPRWGSRKLEVAAIEEAKSLIDAHHAQSQL